MRNHDLASRETRAKIAALAAMQMMEAQQNVSFPKGARSLITEIALRNGLTETLEITGKVILPNTDYWRNFGILKSVMRKIGVGDHPYR
jgi:hypothetical protein